jgi:YHS domain-containing protein
MIRNIFLFLGTFTAGAMIALVARAAWFRPHAEPAAMPAAGGEYASMVTNVLTPAPAANQAPAPMPATPSSARSAVTDPHAGHGAAAREPAMDRPVNSVCAICGMAVDPKLPTAQYQGKTIGFGCKMCPPKFQADPERYGPYYLRNETVKP